MPIDIPQAQINYFDQHGYLELEDYLTESQVETLHAIIEKHIDKTNFDTAYMTGHDLWRTNPAIKKISHSRDFAKIFAELSQSRPLRIGYDQVLHTSGTSKFPFTQKTLSLNEISSLGPPAGGVIINLSKTALETEEIIPHTPGSLLFIKNDLPLPWKAITSLPDKLFLLITYCHTKPLYLECRNDPHLHYLKSMDYAMGDHLTLDTHPLLTK